jgi:hypothetical protein
MATQGPECSTKEVNGSAGDADRGPSGRQGLGCGIGDYGNCASALEGIMGWEREKASDNEYELLIRPDNRAEISNFSAKNAERMGHSDHSLYGPDQ